MRRRFGYSMRLQKKTDRVRRGEQQRVRNGASGARESRLRVDSWTNTAHVGRVRDLHAGGRGTRRYDENTKTHVASVTEILARLQKTKETGCLDE